MSVTHLTWILYTLQNCKIWWWRWWWNIDDNDYDDDVYDDDDCDDDVDHVKGEQSSLVSGFLHHSPRPLLLVHWKVEIMIRTMSITIRIIIQIRLSWRQWSVRAHHRSSTGRLKSWSGSSYRWDYHGGNEMSAPTTSHSLKVSIIRKIFDWHHQQLWWSFLAAFLSKKQYRYEQRRALWTKQSNCLSN